MGIRTAPFYGSFADSYSTKKHWDPTADLEIINPARGHMTCVGYAPSCRRRCQNPINQANRASAHRLLESLSYIDVSTTDISAQLRQLAGLTLCVRYHQGQNENMVRTWTKQIRAQKEPDMQESIQELQRLIREAQLLASKISRSSGQSPRQHFPTFSEDETFHTKWQEPEQSCHYQERVKKMQEEEQRRKRQEEIQRKAREEQNLRRKREEEQRQQERDEKERQRKKREEEERQKKREEEEIQRKKDEQEARREEAREREERKERIRLKGEQVRKEREEKARLQAEKEKQEWSKLWIPYVSRWEEIKKNGAKGTSEHLRAVIPWPVKSGDYKDVSDTSVEEFFKKAVPQDANAATKLQYMKAECMKWHTDRVPRLFGVIEDEALVRIFTTVAQVVVKMKQELQ
ncbi:unnamed protein product [Periconia digitata]|uniref:Uncharacterized protein n=1 Tax=Periconia digitata TaxID=1303443 RepID=A0A9W4U843_9PLEO|nr:unnamed protein product [Periconia digitata]